MLDTSKPCTNCDTLAWTTLPDDQRRVLMKVQIEPGGSGAFDLTSDSIFNV